jgi:8-hydroxy-5-deazaflavin:NADPH oxidoreductase
MKIAILGTGSVGATIGSRLVDLGHQVMMGSRTSNNEKAQAFVSKHQGVNASAGTFSEAAAFGEVIINCTKGEHSLNAIEMAGKAINGKVLIDVSNPLDFSNGMPPHLIPSLANTNSLGEEIQKRFPETKVVKTFNTMWCGIMVDPNLVGGGNHVNYICGNDAAAKAVTIGILKQFGWKDECLLDLGDITNARGTEATLLIWLRVYGATKTGAFNFSIVK